MSVQDVTKQTLHKKPQDTLLGLLGATGAENSSKVNSGAGVTMHCALNENQKCIALFLNLFLFISEGFNLIFVSITEIPIGKCCSHFKEQLAEKFFFFTFTF